MKLHMIVGDNAGTLCVCAMVKTTCSIRIIICNVHINSPFLNFSLKMGAGLFQPRRLPHPAVFLLDEMSLDESQHIGVSFSRTEDFILAETIDQKRYDLLVRIAFNNGDHCVITNPQAGGVENGSKIIGLKDFAAGTICGIAVSIEFHFIYFPFHMLVKRVI